MTPSPDTPQPTGSNDAPEFVDYYLKASVSEQTLARFEGLKRKLIDLWSRHNGHGARPASMCDIGCGAGTQAMIWARDGIQASGVDISAPLVAAAVKRAAEARLEAMFAVGSATQIPYRDHSFDVVILAELLEHVPDWQSVVAEGDRILKAGGVLYLSTANRLCPVQQEFDLPVYSWYPGWLKKRLVVKATTTHRHWVSYADFPAVNWFSFFQLQKHLARLGYQSFDRFDMLDSRGAAATIVRAAVRVGWLRALGHVMSPGLSVFAARKRQ